MLKSISLRWFFGKSKKSKSHSEINRPLIRGDTSIFNHQSQKKSNHWKSISLFTSTEVVFTSIYSQVWQYSFINTWQQEKIKRSLLDDCMLVLSAKTVYSSTNLGSEKVKCCVKCCHLNCFIYWTFLWNPWQKSLILVAMVGLFSFF